MDPVSAFGLTAGVLQVATTAVKTVHTVEQLIHRFHTAPQSVDALFSESTVVSATLSHLVELFERKDNTLVAILRAKPELEKALNRAILGCTAVYLELEKDLQKILPPSPSESNERLGIRRRTSFLWKQDIFKDYLAKIHGHQNVLTLLMQALQMYLLPETWSTIANLTDRRHSLSDISYLLQDTKTMLAGMSRDQQIQHGLTSKAPSYTSGIEEDLEEKVVDSAPYRWVMSNKDQCPTRTGPDQPVAASSTSARLPDAMPIASAPTVAEPLLSTPFLLARNLSEPEIVHEGAIAADTLPSVPLHNPDRPSTVEAIPEADLIDLTEGPPILDAAIEEQVSPAFRDLLSLGSSMDNSTSTFTFQRDSAHSMVIVTPSVIVQDEGNGRKASSIMTPLNPDGQNGDFFGRSLSTSSSAAGSTRSAPLQSELPEVVGNEECLDPFPQIDYPPPYLPLSTKDEIVSLQERRQKTFKIGNVSDQLDWAEDSLHYTSVGALFRERISRLQSKPMEATSVERMLETDAKQLVEAQAVQGVAKALFLKGMYLGLKVAKSTEYHLAALSKGYLRAAFYIGMMYESNKSAKTAINYYKQGADGGDSASKYVGHSDILS